jgi:hypothetical protein
MRSSRSSPALGRNRAGPAPHGPGERCPQLATASCPADRGLREGNHAAQGRSTIGRQSSACHRRLLLNPGREPRSPEASLTPPASTRRSATASPAPMPTWNQQFWIASLHTLTSGSGSRPRFGLQDLLVRPLGGGRADAPAQIAAYGGEKRIGVRAWPSVQCCRNSTANAGASSLIIAVARSRASSFGSGPTPASAQTCAYREDRPQPLHERRYRQPTGPARRAPGPGTGTERGSRQI